MPKASQGRGEKPTGNVLLLGLPGPPWGQEVISAHFKSIGLCLCKGTLSQEQHTEPAEPMGSTSDLGGGHGWEWGVWLCVWSCNRLCSPCMGLCSTKLQPSGGTRGCAGLGGQEFLQDGSKSSSQVSMVTRSCAGSRTGCRDGGQVVDIAVLRTTECQGHAMECRRVPRPKEWDQGLLHHPHTH